MFKTHVFVILRCHDIRTLCHALYYTSIHDCVYDGTQKLTGATSSIDFHYTLHHHAGEIRRAYGLQNDEIHSQSLLTLRQRNQCREALLEYSTIRQHLFQQTVQLRWWSTINLVLCASPALSFTFSISISLSSHLLFISLILVTVQQLIPRDLNLMNLIDLFWRNQEHDGMGCFDTKIRFTLKCVLVTGSFRGERNLDLRFIIRFSSRELSAKSTRLSNLFSHCKDLKTA